MALPTVPCAENRKARWWVRERAKRWRAPAARPAGARDRRHSRRPAGRAKPSVESEAMTGDLVDATGWLAHTTRAALTRLRQAGHVLVAPRRTTRSRKAA